MFELTPFMHRNHSYVTYDPFKALDDMEKALYGNTGYASLKTDITDNGDSYTLEADLPGFNKEDIGIEIDKECLTITAERKTENKDQDKKGNILRSERYYGSFTRSFDISGINAEGITASYENGVLKLILPKEEEKVPATRRLEIK